MPNYSVKIGFGLHHGWAIEGAIGSDFKIDASYLSPNVKIADQLEAMTKLYGVPILISGPLWDYCTEETQNQCRQIDYIEIAGYPDPMKLYTIDLDLSPI